MNPPGSSVYIGIAVVALLVACRGSGDSTGLSYIIDQIAGCQCFCFDLFSTINIFPCNDFRLFTSKRFGLDRYFNIFSCNDLGIFSKWIGLWERTFTVVHYIPGIFAFLFAVCVCNCVLRCFQKIYFEKGKCKCSKNTRLNITNGSNEISTIIPLYFIPAYKFICPYFLRYIIWTIFMTCYLSSALFFIYLWSLSLKLCPHWLETRIYGLKEKYLTFISWLEKLIVPNNIETHNTCSCECGKDITDLWECIWKCIWCTLCSFCSGTTKTQPCEKTKCNCDEKDSIGPEGDSTIKQPAEKICRCVSETKFSKETFKHYTKDIVPPPTFVCYPCTDQSVQKLCLCPSKAEVKMKSPKSETLKKLYPSAGKCYCSDYKETKRTSLTAISQIYRKTEISKRLPRTNCDCIMIDREKLCHTSTKLFCLPSQPDQEMTRLDPNPYRNTCKKSPVKVIQTNPPPLISQFPDTLNITLPENNFLMCSKNPKEECQPDLPRRPPSPDKFKYPVICPPCDKRNLQRSCQINNPCSTTIQKPFQNTVFPNYLELEPYNVNFPLNGPSPTNRPLKNCECEQQAHNTYCQTEMAQPCQNIKNENSFMEQQYKKICDETTPVWCPAFTFDEKIDECNCIQDNFWCFRSQVQNVQYGDQRLDITEPYPQKITERLWKSFCMCVPFAKQDLCYCNNEIPQTPRQNYREDFHPGKFKSIVHNAIEGAAQKAFLNITPKDGSGDTPSGAEIDKSLYRDMCNCKARDLRTKSYFDLKNIPLENDTICRCIPNRQREDKTPAEQRCICPQDSIPTPIAQPLPPEQISEVKPSEIKQFYNNIPLCTCIPDYNPTQHLPINHMPSRADILKRGSIVKEQYASNPIYQKPENLQPPLLAHKELSEAPTAAVPIEEKRKEEPYSEKVTFTHEPKTEPMTKTSRQIIEAPQLESIMKETQPEQTAPAIKKKSELPLHKQEPRPTPPEQPKEPIPPPAKSDHALLQQEPITTVSQKQEPSVHYQEQISSAPEILPKPAILNEEPVLEQPKQDHATPSPQQEYILPGPKEELLSTVPEQEPLVTSPKTDKISPTLQQEPTASAPEQNSVIPQVSKQEPEALPAKPDPKNDLVLHAPNEAPVPPIQKQEQVFPEPKQIPVAPAPMEEYVTPLPEQEQGPTVPKQEPITPTSMHEPIQIESKQEPILIAPKQESLPKQETIIPGSKEDPIIPAPKQEPLIQEPKQKPIIEQEPIPLAPNLETILPAAKNTTAPKRETTDASQKQDTPATEVKPEIAPEKKTETPKNKKEPLQNKSPIQEEEQAPLLSYTPETQQESQNIPKPNKESIQPKKSEYIREPTSKKEPRLPSPLPSTTSIKKSYFPKEKSLEDLPKIPSNKKEIKPLQNLHEPDSLPTHTKAKPYETIEKPSKEIAEHLPTLQKEKPIPLIGKRPLENVKKPQQKEAQYTPKTRPKYEKPYNPSKYSDKSSRKSSSVAQLHHEPKTEKKPEIHIEPLFDKARKRRPISLYDMLEKPSPPDPHLGKFWSSKAEKWKEWSPGTRKRGRKRWHPKMHYTKLPQRIRHVVAKNYYKMMFPHEVDDRDDYEKSSLSLKLEKIKDRERQMLDDFLEEHWNKYLNARKSILAVKGEWTRGWEKTPPSSRSHSSDGRFWKDLGAGESNMASANSNYESDMDTLSTSSLTEEFDPNLISRASRTVSSPNTRKRAENHVIDMRRIKSTGTKNGNEEVGERFDKNSSGRYTRYTFSPGGYAEVI